MGKHEDNGLEPIDLTGYPVVEVPQFGPPDADGEQHVEVPL